MEFLTCNCYGCSNDLLTISEVKNRICEAHRKLIEREDMFVGVCWNCGEITLIENRQWDRKAKEYYIKDKYIFSKSCALCTGNEENNIKWKTILGESVADPVTGLRNRKELSKIAVAEITYQANRPIAKIVQYQNS